MKWLIGLLCVLAANICVYVLCNYPPISLFGIWMCVGAITVVGYDLGRKHRS